jgi:hypothetical protein
MEKRNPIQHQMTRRAVAHDYTRPGLYHITMHVAENLGQPLGAVVGSLEAPDGSADAPHTALTRVGKMVEHELLTAIHQHYPMVAIQDYVIMPDHLHFLMVVTDRLVSKNGTVRTVGDVITGFKVGCNRQYWEITQRTKPAATLGGAGSVAGGAVAGSVSGGSIAEARQPLFAPGYCDVMPVDAAQLATQRAYIKGNPRSRLLRMSNRSQLTVQHNAIITALTPVALGGYLQRECPPSVATAEALAAIEGRLLTTAGDKTAGHSGAGSVAGGSVAGKCFVACDTFGNRALLTEHRCLPVVCHRKDGDRFSEQKQHCLEEAAHGAVLVGTRIAPKEREIMDEAVNHGFPVITLHDNGFADRYHPSADRLDLCAADRLLIVSPWKYQYRGKNEQVTVLFCKAMNCVAQALCRTRDDWWK